MKSQRHFAQSARYWMDNNRMTAVMIVCIVLIFAVGFALYFGESRHREINKDSISIVEAPIVENEEPDGFGTDSITVHIVGFVRSPGVYVLTNDARAMDAVEAAGGFDVEACQDSVNMAQELFDGAQLRIPSRVEVEEGESAVAFGLLGTDGTPMGNAQIGGSSSPQTSVLININTADAALLETLPGIGPSTSAKIIADRTANGPYRSISDLARVSGIGEKKIEALSDLIEAK